MKPTGYTSVYPVFCYIENDGTFKMRFCPKYNNKEIWAARKVRGQLVAQLQSVCAMFE